MRYRVEIEVKQIMRDDYKIQGTTEKLTCEIEKEVAETLLKMEKHMGITTAELTNTALKRFISQHKDFLPKSQGGF